MAKDDGKQSKMKAAADLSLWMKTGRMDWDAQREERQENKQLCKYWATMMTEMDQNDTAGHSNTI